jgi:hypothetical protein
MTGPLSLSPYPWVDYYDFMLDRRAPGVPVWERNTRADFPPRREQLRVLQEAITRHGPRAEVPRWGVGDRQGEGGVSVGPDDQVVVYFDETMHQGEGRRLDVRRNVGPDECWAEFIAPPGGCGQSVRWLKVGQLAFVLRYVSTGDWRSNVRTDSIEVEELALPPGADALCDELQRRYRSPLVAVDLTVSQFGTLWATDLNLAPGLRGSGVEVYLPARQCADEIRRFFYEVCHADKARGAT